MTPKPAGKVKLRCASKGLDTHYRICGREAKYMIVRPKYFDTFANKDLLRFAWYRVPLCKKHRGEK